ncbi:MAG: Gfo/Idh/MocA family oxidoreductase [SAR202 cluster bacterium]|jgi:predicted dehydrogenase|nr:Gfo/Idh/MocA family oxidoreductase [SAR202 cluster bacterium]MDP6715639.1 Gfo/Idh/MocA family oxidoreductase [SAR202 cluster bacterium]
MKLTMCIVGCGGYARNVLGDIHDMTDEFDYYFASRDISKAQQYSEDFGGVGAFGAYEEAAADPRVQSLYFFTPHDTHLDNVKLAAKHGKHILIEKPIARTLDEAQEMIQIARDAGVKLMVAENYRFLLTVDKALEIMRQGPVGDSFGELRQIELQAEGYSVPKEWRTSAEQNGGGVFIDGGIHYVDIMLNIGGYPESVHAIQPPQTHTEVEGEDGILMTARLPGGVAAVINFSRATPIRETPHMVHLTGTKGKLSFVPNGNELSVENRQVRRTVRVPAPRRGVRQMVSEFRKAIEEDREPSMSGLEGTRDLAIVLAAYESARTGEVVRLSEPQT